MSYNSVSQPFGLQVLAKDKFLKLQSRSKKFANFLLQCHVLMYALVPCTILRKCEYLNQIIGFN